MNNKIFVLTLVSLLLVAGHIPIVTAHNAPFPGGYDSTHAVVDTIYEPETLDPAWSYDTISGELIFNVYETVIFYDTVWTDGPYAAGKMNVFKPVLATDVAILPGPAPYVKTFYFKIRGVGTSHTFETMNGGVDLFRDGEIYGGQKWARDPEYGMTGKGIGPVVTPPTAPSANDGLVDRANVSAKQSNGVIATITDTTWQDITQGNEKVVLRTVERDANVIGTLDNGDIFSVIRKDRIPQVTGERGIHENVREYWTVTSVVSASPYTITATPVPVKFHNGAVLSPADVEYSWERWLIQDRDGGPQWMFYYPLMQKYGASSPTDDPNFGAKINDAIGSNATHAWVSLKTDFPETTFLQIMSQPWASILNKAWAVAKGDFDGNWAHGWQYIWNTWHNPPVSFIEDDMMGTGPYKFDYWNRGTAYSIIKNDEYWDGWPAYASPTGTQHLPSFLTRVTWNLLYVWTDRRPRFLAGTSDSTTVPRQYRDQVLGQIVGGEKVRCFYPVEPQLIAMAAFFNFNISTWSGYLGSGFDPTHPYIIAEDRIPVNLFSDIHARRGFAAAFDYDTYLVTAYLGEGEQPSDPIIKGVSYDNQAQTKPVFNLTKAAQELQAAWGGELWANGMTFIIRYSAGNIAQGTAAVMLANNINGLNPKFHLTPIGYLWGPYLPPNPDVLPLFFLGWLADYPDPDNLAYPFMHSQGTFASWQSYSNPRVDPLIEAGALMPDDTAAYNGELDKPDLASLIATFNSYPNIPPDTRWPRRSVYYELQAIYVDDVPGFCLEQSKGRQWEQAWMRGWYYNPVYPGGYFYHRWKAKTHFGDANNDGVVGVLDGATVSASWTKPAPDSALGPLGYKPQADLSGGTGGTTGSSSGLVVGIHDGKVSVTDSALVSSYWDGPPKGPNHP